MCVDMPHSDHIDAHFVDMGESRDFDVYRRHGYVKFEASSDSNPPLSKRVVQETGM